MSTSANRRPGSSRTGTRDSDAGFSLIEVAVVMVIMSIMLGFAAVGSMYYMRTQALIGSASKLETALRDAQVRAQAEVRTYKVLFDTASETYELCRLSGTAYESIQKVSLDAGVDLVSVSYGTAAPSTCTAPPPPSCACVFFEPRGVVTDSAGTIANGTIKVAHTKISQDRDLTIKGLTSRIDIR